MRSEYRTMIQMLGNLDPATNAIAKGVILHLRNGQTWRSWNITVDQNLVYAGGAATNSNDILCVPVDEICGVQLLVNESVREREKIDHTFPAIAKYGEDS